MKYARLTPDTRPECQNCLALGRPTGTNVCLDTDGVYRCHDCSYGAFLERRAKDHSEPSNPNNAEMPMAS